MKKDTLISALMARVEAMTNTQEEAAKMAGISLRTYHRVLSGESELGLNHFVALANAANVTLLDLALDMEGIDGATPWDVAAAARSIPPEARAALVTMIMMIYRDKDQA